MSAEFLSVTNAGAQRCPRFNSCNAPICPLDDWQHAQHLQGEAVCSLLHELVKEGGEARLRAYLPGKLVDTLAEGFPQIAARWGAVRRRLNRASRTGSRMESGKCLGQRAGGTAGGNPYLPLAQLPEQASTHAGYPPRTSPGVIAEDAAEASQ